MKTKMQEADVTLFCERLRLIRTARNISQAYMARKLGISPSLYHYYEKETFPPVGTLKKIADILDVTLDELVGRITPKDESVQYNVFIKEDKKHGCIIKISKYKILTGATENEVRALINRANLRTQNMFNNLESEFFCNTLLAYCVGREMRILDEKSEDYFKF